MAAVCLADGAKKQKAQLIKLGFDLIRGAGCRTRTRHPMITNHVLYLMS
jgi:hypothetical protein